MTTTRHTLPWLRTRGDVLGIPIDAITWEAARSVIIKWARARESRYVCICNVHSVVTASREHTFAGVIKDADLATPDGAPVAWTLSKKGFDGQPRINGPDLMWRLCADAQETHISIGLFGSTPETLDKLSHAIDSAFPGIAIPYRCSPPFRVLSESEDEEICQAINHSGVGLLFVGLGCPKQEAWMAAHRGKISAVMLGVGAAFDYHAGTIARAPEWMRANGLEWAHRLYSEPRRLWRRYFGTNSIFLAKTILDFIRGGFGSHKRLN